MEINRKRVARRLASGLLAGALAFGGLALSGASPAGAVPVELDSDQRLGGADRYATSALVAEEIDDLASGADTLIIANGENFPDALAAAPLADDQPILLVGASAIPSVVRDRMFRLSDTVGDVYVVGGESAVSAAVFAEIEEIFEDSDVMRVSGANRYATAAAIADEVGYDEMVVLASGTSFADAVTIGGWTANNTIPVLLANSGALPAETVTALETALDEGVTRVVIAGGTAVVGPVEEELVELGFAPADITRIAGADRYQTNLLFNLEQLGDTPSKFLASTENDDLNGVTAMLVSGANFPDALAAAPLANRLAAHLILVDPVTGGSALQTLAFASTTSTSLDDYSADLAALLACGNVGTIDGVTASLSDGAVMHACVAGNINLDADQHTMQDLWVVGGTSAVPTSAVSILETIAGGGDVECSISVNGANGSTGPSKFILAFSGNLQTVSSFTAVTAGGDDVITEQFVLSDPTELEQLIEIDGDTPVVSAVVELDLNLDGYTDALSVSLTTPAALEEDVEISFLGIEADAADYGDVDATTGDSTATFLRDFSACDASVAEDEDGPTATVYAVVGSQYTYVEFSEALDADESTALATQIQDDMPASSSVTCARVVATDNSRYLCVEGTATAKTWATGVEIDVTGTAFVDDAGNAMANDTFDVIETADYEPGIDSASKTCAKLGAGEVKADAWTDFYAPLATVDSEFVATTGTVNIEVTAGDVTLTAKSGLSGVSANDWSVTVEHSRGLLLPTAVVDGTTITITIDRYVHTAADIVRVIDSLPIGEGGLSSSWDASTDDADGLVPAAIIGDDLTTASTGDIQTMTCAVTVTMDTLYVDPGATLTLAPVTSTPDSEGEFRITIGGDPVDVGANTGTEWQFDGADAVGVTFTAIGVVETDGTLRVEVFANGELVRLTV